MLYLDTSVFVAALANEAATPTVQAWLGAQDPLELFLSGWTVAEFSSAFAIKLRTGQIDTEHRSRALAAFQRLLAASLTELPIAGSHFRAAAAFLDQTDLALKAADAIHLAVARSSGATLVTLDRRISETAVRLGVESLLLP